MKIITIVIIIITPHRNFLNIIYTPERLNGKTNVKGPRIEYSIYDVCLYFLLSFTPTKKARNNFFLDYYKSLLSGILLLVWLSFKHTSTRMIYPKVKSNHAILLLKFQ